MRIGTGKRLGAVSAVLLAFSALPASAQLDETCVVSALNRTAPVDADGVWVLPNVPANLGPVRARATCVADGVTRSGQSEFFSVPADGIIEVAEIVFDAPQPVPATLSLSAPRWSVHLDGNYSAAMRTRAGRGPIPGTERIESRWLLQ